MSERVFELEVEQSLADILYLTAFEVDKLDENMQEKTNSARKKADR